MTLILMIIIIKIFSGIFLCTPRNINIQGKITDDAEKPSKSTDEELDW